MGSVGREREGERGRGRERLFDFPNVVKTDHLESIPAPTPIHRRLDGHAPEAPFALFASQSVRP